MVRDHPSCVMPVKLKYVNHHRRDSCLLHSSGSYKLELEWSLQSSWLGTNKDRLFSKDTGESVMK